MTQAVLPDCQSEASLRSLTLARFTEVHQAILTHTATVLEIPVRLVRILTERVAEGAAAKRQKVEEGGDGKWYRYARYACTSFRFMRYR